MLACERRGVVKTSIFLNRVKVEMSIFFRLFLLILQFFVSHTQLYTGCGGELREKSGKIKSPNFPSAYPDNSRCSWKITADANEVIALRFEHVDLADSWGCLDSVTVYDGDTDLSPVIVQFCVYKTQEELSSTIIRSRGNQLLVNFSSDYVNHNSGFDAIYWSTVCEPFKYGNDSCDKPCNCVQSNTRFCHSVNGTCVCKSGWTSADCSVDINECTRTNVELCLDYQQCINTIGSYSCGCKPGMVKNSTGQCEVDTNFKCTKSDCSHVCAKVFSTSLTSSLTEQCYCPHNKMLNGTKCADCPLLSYGDNCRFQCKCEANNTERCDPDTGGCICKPGWRSGNCSLDINECELANPVCEPTKICVNTIGSFRCEACQYILNGSNGVITSMNYPNVAPPSSQCTWLISVSNPNATITLRFPKIDLSESILTIYDGVSQKSPLLGSYRVDNDVIIRSTGDKVFILAFNSPWASGQGFNGTYEADENPGCLYQAQAASGNFKLEAGKYKASSDFFFCNWNFNAPSGQVITVKLNEIGNLTNCSQSYLKVYNGTWYNGYYMYTKYCGQDIPLFLRSHDNIMSITYFVNKTGLQPTLSGSYMYTDCNWKYGDACEQNCHCNRSYTQACNNLNGNCECGYGITGADCSLDIDECKINTLCHPALTCRNTFRSYECELEKSESTGKFDCYFTHYWKSYLVTMRGPPNSVISLGISDFDVLIRQDCYIDFSVFNGNITSSQLGYYCGRKVPKLLRTTQNVMTLTTYNNYGGITACHAEYDSHVCLPFKYGPRCSIDCKCLKETTVSCDNLYGICTCKPGYTGPDCSHDIDECPFVNNCTQNSQCINTPGSYICQCLRGYAYNNITGHCEVSQECPEQDRKRCSHTCYLVNEKPQCGCPENLVLDETEKLNCVTPFYTPFGEVISYGLNELDKKIDFNTKLPMGSKTISSAFINKAGVIYFDNSATVNPSIENAHSSAVKLIAPLWAKYDLKKGIISYHLIENCRLSDFTIPTKSFAQTEILKRAANDVKTFRPELYDFEVNTVLIVTWQQLQLPKKTEQLTFQAIFISGHEKKVLYGEVVPDDTELSFAMFIYQKGKDKWGNDHPASIGFTNGDASHDIVKLFPHVLMKLGDHHPDSKFPPGVMMFPVGNTNSHEQKCKQYLCKHVHLKSSDTYFSQINELHKCPCSLDRLALQWDLYERRSNYDCYALSKRAKARLFPKNPRNKMCCYTRPAFNYNITDMRSSTYLQNFPDGGHVLLSDPWFLSPNRKEALKNIEAHNSCCKSPVMCDKFFVIFPDMKCSQNVTQSTVPELADPHMTTLDGVSYSMNAEGEHILLQSIENKFMLQSRTSRVQTNNGQLLNATVFTAFAAQQSNESKFQVELSLTNTTLNVYVDGLDVTKDFYKNEYYNLSTDYITVSRGFKYNKTSVKAIFSCGIGLEIQIGNKSLDIIVQADISLRNKTSGLLGNFNGDVSDEFQMANGTVIPRNSTERKIFMYFVKNYEVNSSTSIFTYEGGERNINYQHPEFVPMFLDEQNPLTLSSAKAFCGALNTPCIYDYIATGDANFAKNTNFTKNEYDALKSSLDNKLPMIKSLNSTTFNNTLWVVTKGNTNTLQIVAADDDGDALTFIIEKKPANLTVSTTGLITYTPWSIPSSPFVVKVKDAKGGYSSSMRVLLAYCSGCNYHGTCTLNSSTVINEVEKLKCQCQPAFTGEDCESELDACSLSPCQPGRVCKDLSSSQQGNNTVGYTCGPCPAGFYIGDDDICIDTDECTSVGTCSQVCTNTYGSFQCSCQNGYRLDQIDKKSCIDINECEEKTALCQQGCQNINGNYTCTCFDGYTLHSDGLHCVLNASRQSTCQICQQFCTVIEDTATCGCHNGFKKDPNDFTKCIDINECSEGNMPCSQVCTNTVGHYECSCYAGYQLNNDSTTCRACKSPYYGENCNSTCECGLNGICDPIRGCICLDGWTGEKCTIDINECNNVTVCPAGQICSNILGRYQCTCSDGFTKINGTCKDIDECSDLKLGSFCSSELNEICINTIGSYQCQCKTGFYRNKLSVCQDIDECSSGIDGCEQICENTVGSFNCKCYTGYWKSLDRKHCINVKDICKNRNMTCSHNCTLDANGQPYCVCLRGYQLINSNTCQDINECAISSLNLCSYKERCINTEGGFTCSCPLGQTLDNNERTCIDCEGETWGLQCANQCACGLGSLKCDPATGCFCKPGFKGQYCDEDVDECVTGQQKCSINEVCVNKPGSAECQCQNGFIKKNGICTDINECQDKYLHNCKQNCTNTIGSFSCSCYTGYMLNTTTNTCIDINECLQRTHQCSGTCINTEGSYSCSCSSGLILQEDGLTCAEPYSCGSYKCSEHLKCRKIGTNHICLCYNGRLPDLNGNCIDCNRVLTEKNGTFMSTNYPFNYPDNSDCAWTIKTNITNAFITLSFQSYDVEGCPYDYIEVYDGNSTKSNLLGRYCDTIPNTIMSSSNSLHVVFTSDTSENQKGFLASYVSAVSCRLKKCSHNCQVTVTNPWTETCICPDWMKLDSTGTECKIINACNTTVNASSGYIVSPNYPNNYPDNSSCYWTIAGSNSSRVNMSFSEFSLEGGEGCPYDYVNVFDGFNKSAPLLGRFCSDTIPSTTLSTKNALHFIFKSDGSANSKGFKIFYSST